MELGLSLGDAPARPPPLATARAASREAGVGLDLGFCMRFGVGFEGRGEAFGDERSTARVYADPTLQLALLPPGSFQRRSPPPPLLAIETGDPEASTRGFDVNRSASDEAATEDFAAGSSNFSAATAASGGVGGGESSRASDDEENGLARKKLRLSKDQAAFLEESFKEHSTLNPKQKLALAKQLNLRPRQVEVWFQNRRARTKLKQTEVDCEYLKRCCETLTAENRRLQKELSDLRTLKTAANPLYTHLPATTLSMCPSCERVSAAAAGEKGKPSPTSAASFAALLAKPRLFPFAAAI